MPVRLPSRLPLAAAFVAVVGLAGCRTTAPVVSEPAAAAIPAHDNLNAILWMQTAEEYRAVALSVYRGAEARLADALADTAWSADPEQLRRRGYGRLPTAVVLDVDETVLDNSAYAARGIVDGTAYAPATWGAWVREGRETAIAGALAYTQAAAAHGIRVVYLTNRMGD